MCSFPNPAKSDTVQRRMALTSNLAWYQDWCNASVPKDADACSTQMQVPLLLPCCWVVVLRLGDREIFLLSLLPLLHVL
jgi:hypothetical protein